VWGRECNDLKEMIATDMGATDADQTHDMTPRGRDPT